MNRFGSYLLSLIIVLLGISAGLTYSKRNDNMATGSASGELVSSHVRWIQESQAWNYQGRVFPIDMLLPVGMSNGPNPLPQGFGVEIVVLLGSTGCSPCQVRELSLIDELIAKTGSHYKGYGLLLSGYSQEQDRAELDRLKRLGSTYSLTAVDRTQLATFTENMAIPAVFILSDGIVTDMFAPIPDDNEYSERFYSALATRAYGVPSNTAAHEYSISASVEHYGSTWMDSISPIQTSDITTANDPSPPIYLVNQWATWCKPCIRELPSLIRLKNQFRNSEVGFYFISSEKERVIIEYLRKQKFATESFYSGALPSGLHSEAIPSTVVLNREGEVLYTYVGALEWDSPRIKDMLDSFIKREHK